MRLRNLLNLPLRFVAFLLVPAPRAAPREITFFLNWMPKAAGSSAMLRPSWLSEAVHTDLLLDTSIASSSMAEHAASVNLTILF